MSGKTIEIASFRIYLYCSTGCELMKVRKLCVCERVNTINLLRNIVIFTTIPGNSQILHFQNYTNVVHLVSWEVIKKKKNENCSLKPWVKLNTINVVQNILHFKNITVKTFLTIFF